MDLALALLLLWGLLFVPLGIVLHWLVLGEGSRPRALVVAPITGIGTAIVVLATLGRLGVDAGEPWVAWAFVAVSAACVVVIWRAEIPWRTRELLGAGALLLFALLLVQLPVVGSNGEGPLGYGTPANPVEEVAAIEVAAHGPAARLGVAETADETVDERPIGFEQFAALTVAIGLDDSKKPGSIAQGDASWTAYGLHAAITGMLAALISLPLFAFARARGVRWFGLLVLVPLGVFAPAVFLALANGEGAAIASVPFTTCGAFCLLVTRRDRGWWALVVLNGAAIAAVAGPLALLPLVAIGITWMFLRSDTYEHLSQHDTPVARTRTLVTTVLAAVGGTIATLPLLGSGGELLAWEPLHRSLRTALQSWPFAWLDSDLAPRGPVAPLEHVVWIIGPTLLAVAIIYAIVRNERRELGVLLGAIAAAGIAVGVAVSDESAGIRLYEFTILSVSPFLAALTVRAVALAREYSQDARASGTAAGKFAGVGPLVLAVVFVLLSFSATAVTGTRMVHAPATALAASSVGASTTAVSAEKPFGDALIASGDPWLSFVIDGERVRGGEADADAISEERNRFAKHGIRTTAYDSVVLSSSPLSSDPSLAYVEQGTLDGYQVRLFRNLQSGGVRDDNVEPALKHQLQFTQTADRVEAAAAGTEPAADAAATPEPSAEPATGSGDAKADATDAKDTAEPAAPKECDDGSGRVCDSNGEPSFLRAQVHTPVEQGTRDTPPNTSPSEPAGLLLPSSDVPGCDLDTAQPCKPQSPIIDRTSCTDAEVAAARSELDRTGAKATAAAKGSRASVAPQVLEIDEDLLLPEKAPLIGVQCFDVPLEGDSSVLLVHLRDIGNVLGAETGERGGPKGAWKTTRTDGKDSGGVDGDLRWETDELDASITYGGGRLLGSIAGWDLVLEGTFGAGLEIAAGAESTVTSTSGESAQIDPVSIGTLHGASTGFSQILRGVAVPGSVTLTNSNGTDVSVGRLFARSRDLPRSCDVPIALAADEQREIRVEPMSITSAQRTERAGLTVTIVGIDEADGARTARVAVGSYLARRGLPRYTLVDWTEQYDAPIPVEGCDGVTHIEQGAEPGASDALIDESQTQDIQDAIGDAQPTDLTAPR